MYRLESKSETLLTYKDLSSQFDYPWKSITLSMLIILLSPFTSYYLNAIAFAICFFRAVKYGVVTFSTDYCILLTVTLPFQLNNSMNLLPYLCLITSIWFLCIEGIQTDPSTIILIVLCNYLLYRMNGDYNNFVLCFSQFLLLKEMLRKQSRSAAVQTSKLFCISLLISSLYAVVLRSTPQLIALKGKEVPAYWMSDRMRFYGLFADPNYYMALLVIAIALLIKLRIKGELNLFHFGWMISATVAFGLLTYSKTFLLLIIIICIIYIALQLKSRKPFLAVAFVIGTTVCFNVSKQIQGSPLQIILYRLSTATNTYDLTTGRSELYKRYIDAIGTSVKSFLIGYGLNAEYLGLSPHNLFLEILYYLGALGMMVFLATIAAFIYLVRSESITKQSENFLIQYYPLILISIVFSSLSGMFGSLTYVMLFLSLIAMLI